MDHESAAPTAIYDRPILPPISSMDGFFASRSWPPPATSLASTSLTFPSVGSTNNNISMHESNTLSSPISHNKNEPWIPIPKQDNHPGNRSRLDYFTMTATANALSSAAAENYNQSDHHYRQNSLPHISTFRKNSITSSSSSSYQSPSDQNRSEQTNNAPPSSSSSATQSKNNNNNLINGSGINSSSHSTGNNNNTSIEMVLTPNSLSTPSIRSIERDIEEASTVFSSRIYNSI